MDNRYQRSGLVAVPDDLMREMIEEPYGLVVAGMPKAQRERLGWVALRRGR